MAKKHTKKQKTASKTLTIFAVIAFLIIGTLFAVLDKFDILTYGAITSALGLSEKVAVPNEKNDVSVHFIDVGQGDATLIICGNTTVLIDAGESDYGEAVCSYLSAAKVTNIDYLIGTHPHSDHIGGLSTVIKKFPIGKIILPKIPDNIVPTSQTYRILLNTIQVKGLTITPAVSGTAYNLGNDTVLKIIAPLKNTSEDLNDYSIVARLTCGKNSFLFTGDAENNEESDILESGTGISSDVLKIGHHGSNTSSSKEFIEAVSPKYCVIMVGADNSYNHPNKKAVNRLRKHTEQIFRTDLQGTIVFNADGENITYYFEKGD